MYSNVIEELQNLYEYTPATDRHVRARIQSGLKKSKREWAKNQLNMRCSRNTRPEK